MKPKILLANPPIYDLSAYDFRLKPYGLLSVGGRLRKKADLLPDDPRGRGRFPAEIAPKPEIFRSVPRHYRRYGLPRGLFREYLEGKGPFDFALVQTAMTYWYPGAEEVIRDLSDPISRNKTAFAARSLGWEEIHRLKRLSRPAKASA
jgi:hypothetical protein